MSFDGDLGCNVSRLKDIVRSFYSNAGSLLCQNVDDIFCAFVWSLVVQHPTVQIGVKPPSVVSEVWIAPQTSAKRKVKAQGEDLVEESPPRLILIPDAKNSNLKDLIQRHSEDLRIAIEPEAIYAAITGSHIKLPKLSPMVYTALQIITRGRDVGVSVVELGQKSKYDQKTCFYLVKQLTELGLIVKVRRGGVGTHFCIHRYFFEKSPSWKEIRSEENEAEVNQHVEAKQSVNPGAEEVGPFPGFTPIDARHLSSLPLVRARVVKLLRASRNHIHPSGNILITIGFAHPTKTDRRFFQSRIRELIHQGVVEKIIVPSNRRKSGETFIKCYRLITDEDRPTEGEVAVPSDSNDEREEAEGVKLNVTIHKQILNLLEETGADGMTLQDLSAALSDFDKRTIELLLARAESHLPPPHLSDLGVISVMETSGRERRHRYYTTDAYRKLVIKEKLESVPSHCASNNLEHAGEFSILDPKAFYGKGKELLEYQDGFKDKLNMGKPRKRPLKNPILPDGRVKLGRPRKRPIEDSQEDQRGASIETPSNSTIPVIQLRKKRRTDNVAQVISGSIMTEASPILKRRGRPPKAKESSSAGATQTRKRNRSLEMPEHSRPETRSQKRLRSLDASTQPTDSSVLYQNAPDMTPDIPVVLNNIALKRNNQREPLMATETIKEGLDQVLVSGGASIMQDVVNNQSRTVVLSSLRLSSNPPNQTSGINDQIVEKSRGAPDSVQEIQEQITIPIDPTLLEASRYQPATPSNEPPKAALNPFNIPRTKFNVSQLRRENELFRIVVEQGGIVNIQSKDFYAAHKALLETLSKAGETASAPVGTTIDKRTLAASLDNLERRGRLKQLKTSITTHTGAQRSVSVVHLPDLSQNKVNSYLADLSRGTPIIHHQPSSYVKLGQRVEYGAGVSSGALPSKIQLDQSEDDNRERLSRNCARADQLFNQDHETIRNILLTERTTVAQYYGFIVGKIARARQLHLSTLKAFDACIEATGILCHQHRIVDLSYYCYDIPLDLYCSLVPVVSYDEELKNCIIGSDKHNRLVRDLPKHLHTLLQTGRSRARSRFLDILEILRLLGLVTPLKTSSTDISEGQVVLCPHNGKSKVFQTISQDIPINIHSATTTRWLFHTQAPIYLWAASETTLPFWKEVTVSTEEEGLIYWTTLQGTCINTHITPCSSTMQSVALIDSQIGLGRSLRRVTSWSSDYVFTWYQTQYMKHFVDVHTGDTPMEESNEELRESRLRQISWVISAPEECIRVFYSITHQKMVRELDKVKRKAERRLYDKRTAETRALLAKRAAEAKQQREQDWEKLASRIHSLPLPQTVAIKNVYIRFIQASSIQDDEKWEHEISEALREAEIMKKNKLPGRVSTQDSPESLSIASWVATSPVTKPDILLSNKEAESKKRSKHVIAEKEKPTQRRHRFQWNQEYDELAQDASAIIRSRCRPLSRLDWGAFEQVFPSVPRNTVRQRLAHIREAPGNDAYLNRLEQRWHELWLQHRGSAELPDDDPNSPTNFDLAKHVEFLRENVDKNALRVGFAQLPESPTWAIPSSVEAVIAKYSVHESIPSTSPWDFMWNATVEEGREKRLMRQPFTRYPEEIPTSTHSATDSIAVAEAALKMTLGTPHERYEAERASVLLHSVGESSTENASKNLLNRGVLSKLVRDPQKQKPGRQLKISELNQNAIGGTVPRDTFQDAASLEELAYHDNNWREWPLLATDGDTAALVQAVSDGKIEFKLDTSQAQLARPSLDWNSKKADDDQIETAISVRFGNPDGRSSPVATSPIMLPGDLASPHGCTEGPRRCCKGQVLNTLIDCDTCIEDEWASLASGLDEEDKCVGASIIQIVRDAGACGVTKAVLQEAFNMKDCRMLTIIRRLTEPPVPILFWAGYNRLVLVSSTFLEKWSVVISENPFTRTFPRRWYDIAGSKIPDYWEAALRAVLGVVVFRPGITQYELRWRLRSVYDRQEVNDLLQYLHEEDYLEIRQKKEEVWMPFEEDEEKEVYWFIGERRHWYQT
ncbi:hypothetical protein AMATHDRAFT_52646 [Amanita thiersii Skay4041]|uniref:Uncharacterized protein n=1 Tax=Amanita thiersii Skay4041 TaxID=703135 RepID=A0A2A9NYQ6_9AGAR|nr:hypothetical protein AMATHDRAFT_52646 [Amanita thiersii Skay4041]